LTPRETAYTVRRWIATGVLEAETIKEGKRNRHRIRKSLIETMENRILSANDKTSTISLFLDGGFLMPAHFCYRVVLGCIFGIFGAL